MEFKYPKYKEKKFKIFSSTQNYGIQKGKLVKSNKFIKFKNFIFKKKINSNKVKIKNFPFPIINIKLDTKENKTLLIIRKDKKKRKKLYFKKNWIFEKKDNYNNFYSKPIRNIEIFNKDKIKFEDLGSRLATGSSANNNNGFLMIALAIPTLCL